MFGFEKGEHDEQASCAHRDVRAIALSMHEECEGQFRHDTTDQDQVEPIRFVCYSMEDVS